MTKLKKATLIVMFAAWVISGILWYATENYEPAHELQRRPAAELNTIADDLLSSMGG